MISGISSSSSLMTAIMAKLSQSQSAANQSKSLFSKADADGSGKVSVDELAALAPKDSNAVTATQIVTSADSDGDNELTESELLSYFSQMSTGGLSGQNNTQLASTRTSSDVLSAADANNDGTLSYDEFASMNPDDVSEEQSQSLFKSADANSDGSLSEDEITALESNKPQEGGMKGAMMGPPPPPPSDEDDDEDETTISSILSKLIESLTSTDSTDETEDTDSTTETASTSTETDEEKIFNFFDKDGDGTVSEDELNTGVSALKTAMSNYLLSLQESRAAA